MCTCMSLKILHTQSESDRSLIEIFLSLPPSLLTVQLFPICRDCQLVLLSSNSSSGLHLGRQLTVQQFEIAIYYFYKCIQFMHFYHYLVYNTFMHCCKLYTTHFWQLLVKASVTQLKIDYVAQILMQLSLYCTARYLVHVIAINTCTMALWGEHEQALFPRHFSAGYVACQRSVDVHGSSPCSSPLSLLMAVCLCW